MRGGVAWFGRGRTAGNAVLRLKLYTWRGVRVVEGARLEIVLAPKRYMGSNPILSGV